MGSELTQEIWQVETDGQVFDTNFAEITTWIEQGSLLRQDKVRKGNLRWIEAGKVPALISVFNAVEHGQPIAPVITTTRLEPAQLDISHFGRTHRPAENPPPEANATPQDDPAGNACSMHADIEAAYICDTCFSKFCRTCPTSYGGNVKICPYCGAMCSPVVNGQTRNDEAERIRAARSEPFGFGDFGRAILHPFNFTSSLVIGGIMYSIFSVGRSAASMGGFMLMASAIICFMLANMLTFGVLANTVENFTQGKLDTNFMPSFDDFSLWDDVVHPMFLSIGAYISSFGPLILIGLIAFFMVLGAVKDEMSQLPTKAAQLSEDRDLPFSDKAARQSEQVRQLVNRQAEMQQERVDALENGVAGLENKPARPTAADPDEKYYQEMNDLIAQQRKAQLESAIGKTPETEAKERSNFIQRVLGYGLVFVLFGGIALLWGLFYFPAACAVAGYTRSFTATINPLVGLDTINRLGSSYVLILIMGLILMIASGFVSMVFSMILSPFDLPLVGNILATAISTFFGFYLSVVFSCVIGYALFKAADRLELFTT